MYSKISPCKSSRNKKKYKKIEINAKVFPPINIITGGNATFVNRMLHSPFFMRLDAKKKYIVSHKSEKMVK